MLQRLLELKPEVLCDTVHGALTHVLQQLLVTGHAAVDLVGRATDPSTTDARTVFDRVRSVLVQSHFLDADAPISETKAGIRKMIARLHEELAEFEGSEEARQSDPS